jgi:hypothetical protein
VLLQPPLLRLRRSLLVVLPVSLSYFQLPYKLRLPPPPCCPRVLPAAGWVPLT